MLIKDITVLERVQHKFITGNFTASYRDRLLELKILPLMYWYELQDVVVFLVKCSISPPDNFDYVSFVGTEDRLTRSSASSYLRVKHARTTLTRHSFLNLMVRLWNSLPHNDLSVSLPTTRQHLLWVFLATFFPSF